MINLLVIKPYYLQPEQCDKILDYLKYIRKDCKLYSSLRKYAADVLKTKSTGGDILNKDIRYTTFDNDICIISNGGENKSTGSTVILASRTIRQAKARRGDRNLQKVLSSW